LISAYKKKEFVFGEQVKKVYIYYFFKWSFWLIVFAALIEGKQWVFPGDIYQLLGV